MTKGDPFKVPLWKKVLEANDPRQFTAKSPVPLLMIQGGNDEQIPVASTQLLANHLCDLHQVLQRWVYPGQSHAGVIGPSAGDMIALDRRPVRRRRQPRPATCRRASRTSTKTTCA